MDDGQPRVAPGVAEAVGAEAEAEAEVEVEEGDELDVSPPDGVQAHWYPEPLIVVVTVTVCAGVVADEEAADDDAADDEAADGVAVAVELEEPPMSLPPIIPAFWLGAPTPFFR